MRLDFADLDRKLKYKVMTAAIIPRPPALVTTVDLEGTPNAGPYSFFNGFSDDPPIVGLGIARRDSGPKKDTGRNIEETGEFVCHIVSEDMFSGMLVTAAEFPEGVDEIPLAGFQTVACDHIKPPRIVNAPVAFECRRHTTVQLGSGTSVRDVVLGEIIAAHVRDDMWDDEKQYIDWSKTGFPIGRLYGELYANLGEAYRGPVPNPKDLMK
ncbi:MAG: flavin reductase family protein [Pseudomonadota bacterium]